MFTELLSRLSRRQQEQKQSVVTDAKSLIITIARAELDGSDVPDEVIEQYAEVLDSAGLTEADIELNVDIYRRRVEAAQLAAKVEHLGRKAAEAEQAWIAADRAEAERHKAALHELDEMRTEMAKLLEQHGRALAARGDLLAQADRTDEEQQLSDQLIDLKRRAAELDEMLKVNPRDVQLSSPVLDRHPVAYRENVVYELDQIKTGKRPATKEEREAVEARLAKADAVIAAKRAERDAIDKERAAINERLEALNRDKLKPESFELRKAKPSRDELAKRQAERLGYTDSHTATLTVG
jgi:hypothetical protein